MLRQLCQNSNSPNPSPPLPAPPQDVASYVIARTLGVIDETKASTGGEHLQQKDAPSIVVHRDGDGDGDADTALAASTPLPPDSPDDSDPDGLPGNLKLAGVGTFSPAPSQPASPTLQRRELLAGGAHAHAHLSPLSPLDDAATGLYTSPGRRGARARAHDGRTGGAAAGEAPAERGAEATDGEGRERQGQGQGQGARRAARGSAASTSGSSESSFALVDRDSGSGSEDAGVVLRRRTRPPGTGAGAGPDAEDGVA